ncbi:MAG TPA: hypothetical protein VKA21_01680, partial [Candidatus Binatia bacterium]|nr:hypothetical protein [Candidatus Binatia bacterium]
MTGQEPGEDRTADASFRAAAYPPWWRALAAAAFVASRVSLPLILLAILRSHFPITADTVLRWFAQLFVLPALAAAIVDRGLRARVAVDDRSVRIARAGLRAEV